MGKPGLRQIAAFAFALAVHLPALASLGSGGARFGVFNQDSDNYQGMTYQGSGFYRFTENLEANLLAENLNRSYGAGGMLSDTTIGIGAVWKRQRSFYLETLASLSTSADIFAKWSVLTAPHVVSGAHDIGLAASYSEYREVMAGALSPSYFYSVTDHSGLGLSAFVVRTGTTISSLQGRILIGIAEGHSLRMTGSMGRALEDAGLEADFKSFGAQYGIRLKERWLVEWSLVNYWSEIRRERSIGVSVGYR